MTGRRASRRDALLTLAAACLALLWGVFLAARHLDGEASVLDRAEALSADLRFLVAGPRPPPDDLVIVAIDDETVQEAGAFPLPRATVARLVEALAELEPKAIALDLLFLEPGPPDGDRALAEVLRRTPSVIAAAGLFARGPDRARSSLAVPEGGLEAVPFVDRVLWPVGGFRDAAAVGLVNVSADASGTPRHIPLVLRGDRSILASFPLRVAAVAARANPVLQQDRVTVGGRTTRVDLGFHLPLNFYGPRGGIRTISAGRVLRREAAGDDLRGRLFIVGATAIGSGDTFANAFDPVLPGVEVLATAVGHLVVGDGLVRDGRVRRIDAAAAIVLPVAAVLLMALRRTAIGFALIAAVAALWIAITIAAFLNGFWLSVSVPLAAIVPATILYGGVRLWLDRRAAGDLATAQETLRRFQPPVIADRLAADPDFLAEPVRQKAAILFIDLSGFTGVSETLGPDATRDLLKDFHSRLGREVAAEGGLVVSFMGDGAMILFGLPEADPEDPCRAVRAAVRLATATSAWLGTLPVRPRSPLGFRIGAHFGSVVVSRLGADSYQHITATGDTVNVASRLLEVASRAGAVVAISEDLVQAAGPACSVFDAGVLDAPEEIAIRGRVTPLRVRFWRQPAPVG